MVVSIVTSQSLDLTVVSPSDRDSCQDGPDLGIGGDRGLNTAFTSSIRRSRRRASAKCQTGEVVVRIRFDKALHDRSNFTGVPRRRQAAAPEQHLVEVKGSQARKGRELLVQAHADVFASSKARSIRAAVPGRQDRAAPPAETPASALRAR